MIKVGDKVKYISKDIWDPLFKKDIEEFNDIFEVMGVNNDLVFVKSKYNFERSEEAFVRGLETHNEKYWCLNKEVFREYFEIIEFDNELDKLFDI